MAFLIINENKHCINLPPTLWGFDCIAPITYDIQAKERSDVQTCGWAKAPLIFLETLIGRSYVAHPREYTTTSSNGGTLPIFLALNMEQTKSSTQTSVHIPTTKTCTK